MKILSQDSRSTGRELNPGPPKYETRVAALVLKSNSHSQVVYPVCMFPASGIEDKRGRGCGDINLRIFLIHIMVKFTAVISWHLLPTR
jgi:hypothetical protein